MVYFIQILLVSLHTIFSIRLFFFNYVTFFCLSPYVFFVNIKHVYKHRSSILVFTGNVWLKKVVHHFSLFRYTVMQRHHHLETIWHNSFFLFFSFYSVLNYVQVFFLCSVLRLHASRDARRVDKIIARNNDTTIWKNRRSSFAYPWAIVKTIRVCYETYIYRRNRKIPNCVQWKCKKIFSGILSPICIWNTINYPWMKMQIFCHST